MCQLLDDGLFLLTTLCSYRSLQSQRIYQKVNVVTLNNQTVLRWLMYPWSCRAGSASSGASELPTEADLHQSTVIIACKQITKPRTKPTRYRACALKGAAGALTRLLGCAPLCQKHWRKLEKNATLFINSQENWTYR